MIKNKMKKGFTLVELLVVIAILAILATVSIVGYTSFTKKAKISNDTSFVKQLNTALQADEVINGKARTPSEALKVVADLDFEVEDIKASTPGYQILWNQANNQFVLIDDNNASVFGELDSKSYYNWRFLESYKNIAGNSVYLYESSSSAQLEELDLVISTGLDVGNNKNIKTITYQNDLLYGNTYVDVKDITIVTNGGNLIINDSIDVNHYGSASLVTLQLVANYNLYGQVNFISADSGNVVLESESKCSVLQVNNDATANVKINQVTVVADNNENVSAPSDVNVLPSTSQAITTIEATEESLSNGETLQNAVDNENVTVILLKEGTYTVNSASHNLLIERDNLTIIGDGNAVITSTYSDGIGDHQQTIMIRGNNVTLSNLVVEPVIGYYNKTLEIMSGNNIVVENCHIKGNIYIGGTGVGKYSILNNIVDVYLENGEVKDVGSLCIANGAGNAILNNEKSLVSGNIFNGSLILNGTRCNGWDLNELKNLPLIENNTFQKETMEIGGQNYTFYIRFASTQESITTAFSVDLITTNNRFDERDTSDWNLIGSKVEGDAASCPQDHEHATYYNFYL